MNFCRIDIVCFITILRKQMSFNSKPRVRFIEHAMRHGHDAPRAIA